MKLPEPRTRQPVTRRIETAVERQHAEPVVDRDPRAELPQVIFSLARECVAAIRDFLHYRSETQRQEIEAETERRRIQAEVEKVRIQAQIPPPPPEQ